MTNERQDGRARMRFLRNLPASPVTLVGSFGRGRWLGALLEARLVHLQARQPFDDPGLAQVRAL